MGGGGWVLGWGQGRLHMQTLWPLDVATRHLPCQGNVHGAMAAVPGHGSPTGALQRRHYLNYDITGSADLLIHTD